MECAATGHDHFASSSEPRKGCGTETAFRYLLDSGVAGGTVVTVDADGQHLPADVRSVCDAAHQHPDALILGVRQFGPDTPARSQIGNRLASALFHAASRRPLRDTQTGLRAFSVHMLPWLLDIPGERYEYEMMQCRHGRLGRACSMHTGRFQQLTTPGIIFASVTRARPLAISSQGITVSLLQMAGNRTTPTG